MYTVAWLVWIVAFGVIEGRALLTRTPGATLSEHVWRWFRVLDPRSTPLTWTLRVVLALFLVWLSGHLGLGWWTLSDPWP